jgi:membrane-associated phospholipid phosphatase
MVYRFPGGARLFPRLQLMRNSANENLSARVRSLARRVGPDLAWCLSLAFGFGALLLLAYLASWLFQRIPDAPTTAFFDVPISRYVAEHRTGWLTAAMGIVTDLGGDGVLLIVVLVIGVILRRETGTWRPLLVLLAIAVGAIELERLIKLIVARPRPPVAWRVFHENGWSFPSGHATHSAAVYGSVAYLTTHVRPLGRRARAAVWATAIGACVLIGVSRVYLGAHWPTDVIGGWIFAIVWLWMALSAPPL